MSYIPLTEVTSLVVVSSMENTCKIIVISIIIVKNVLRSYLFLQSIIIQLQGPDPVNVSSKSVIEMSELLLLFSS